MRAIIHGWSALGLGSRLITVILTGVAWTAISMQHVLLHPEFWDPVTLTDYVAVYSFSVALLLMALSLLIFRELAPAGVNVPALLVVAAGGFVVAGVANMLEDGLGFRALGPVYVVGIVVGVVVLLVAAVRIWMSGARRMSLVPAVSVVAMAFVTVGGGLLALAPWLGLAGLIIRERQRP